MEAEFRRDVKEVLEGVEEQEVGENEKPGNNGNGEKQAEERREAGTSNGRPWEEDPEEVKLEQNEREQEKELRKEDEAKEEMQLAQEEEIKTS